MTILENLLWRGEAFTFRLINRSLANPVFDLLMPALSDKRLLALPLLVGLVALGIWGGRRGRIAALSVVVAVLVADAATQHLWKPLIDRIRPCHALSDARVLGGCSASYSFPSNHASNIFALGTVLTAHYRRALVPLLALGLAVGYSRVYLGAHYPSDVLGGAVWGILLGLSLGWLGQKVSGPPKDPDDGKPPAC